MLKSRSLYVLKQIIIILKYFVRVMWNREDYWHKSNEHTLPFNFLLWMILRVAVCDIPYEAATVVSCLA